MSEEVFGGPERLRCDGDFGNLSFAGCGFLGIYHVGVASCVKEYAPHLYAERISGASAGALVACALITGACLGECTTFTLKLALQARSRTLGPLSPSFRLVENLRKALCNFLPDNAHEIANGRLFISLTRVRDKKNVLVSQFKDKEDLMDALICSSFVPLYSGFMPPSYRGVRYVDGALSDNIPVWNKGTITVSPFAGESDICPDDQSCNLHHMNLAGTSMQFTAGNLYRLSVAFFPPSPEILSNMCRQGFDDALRFLKKNRLISCTQHLSIKSDIISSSPLQFDLFEEDVATEQGNKNSTEYKVTINSEASDEDTEWSCCDECEERERIALLDSPPILVQTALQAACDEVNRGFMAKIYKSKVYRVLSLMATPYVLPFEVAYQLVRKLYDWGPYMPEDMQWFLKGLYRLSLDLLSSCESAIKSPSGWQLNHLAVTMGIYFGMQVGHTHHRKASIHRKRSTVRKLSITRGNQEHPPSLPEEHEAQDRTALSQLENLPNDVIEQGFSMNFGININYVQSPVQCARNARVHLNEHEHSHHRKHSLHADASYSGALQQQGAAAREVPVPTSLTTSKGLVACDESYDTFDNYFNVAKQMDSILSYYYLEEDDPTKVRVVEIFPVHPTPGTKPDV